MSGTIFTIYKTCRLLLIYPHKNKHNNIFHNISDIEQFYICSIEDFYFLNRLIQDMS